MSTSVENETEHPRKFFWPVLLSLVPALAWQAFVLVRWGAPSPYRAAAIVAIVVALVVCLRRASPPGLVLRLFLVAVAAAALGSAVLELALTLTSVLALGLLLVVAATLALASALLHATRPAGRDPLPARLLRGAGVSLAVLALVLSCAELALRIPYTVHNYPMLADQPGSPACLVDPGDGRFRATRGFRGEYVHPEFPGVRVEINDWGLRDGLDEATSPAEGEASVVVLGDSFAFGLGVSLEDTFHARLQARGAEITRRPLRVYGAGIPGYAMIQERQMLEDLAERTRPDVVVVALFEGNDFPDNWYNLRKEREEAAAGGPAPRPLQVNPPLVAPAPGDPRPPLGRFLRWTRRRAFWMGTCVTLRPMRGRYDRYLAEAMLVDPPERVAEIRDAGLDQVERIRDVCDELGAELVCLMVPSNSQSVPADFEVFLSTQPEDQRPRFQRTAFHEELVTGLEARGLRVVDPLGALEADGRGYHREGHWNARGHELAAEALVPVLAEVFSAR